MIQVVAAIRLDAMLWALLGPNPHSGLLYNRSAIVLQGKAPPPNQRGIMSFFGKPK